MAEERQTVPNDDFCEHEVQTCVFCSKRVRYGHMRNEGPDEHGFTDMILIHDLPSCPEFKLCDSIKEFAMLTMLKIKSDTGQLERN